MGLTDRLHVTSISANHIIHKGQELFIKRYVTLDAGGDNAESVAASGLTANAVHILGGNLTSGAITVTLPTTTATPSIGTYYTFLVGMKSTANGPPAGHVIKCGTATDKLIGSIEYVRVPSTGLATANFGTTAASNDQTSVVHITPNQDTTTDDLISLDGDKGDGGGIEGSWVTFIYIGTPDGTNATWLVNGKVISHDPNGTGAHIFGAA